MTAPVPKSRIETLSDALFAIVMTLLVLEIKAPAGVPHQELVAELTRHLPAWIAFAVTFFMASMFWVTQHKVLHALSKISKENLILSFLFLALITILPFSTSLWGNYVNDSLGVAIYFSNLLAVALALTAQLEIAVLRKHVVSPTTIGPLRFRLAAMCIILATAVVSAYIFGPRYVSIAPLSLVLVRRIVQSIWERKRQNANTMVEA